MVLRPRLLTFTYHLHNVEEDTVFSLCRQDVNELSLSHAS